MTMLVTKGRSMQEARLVEQPRDANAKLRSHVPDFLSHPQEPVEDWRSESRQGLALDLPACGGEPRDRELEGGGKPASDPACALALYSLRVDATQNGSTLSCVNVKEEGANLMENEIGRDEMRWKGNLLLQHESENKHTCASCFSKMSQTGTR